MIVDAGNYYRLRLTIIPVLRLRLVVALFRGRAFLLHLPKRLSHVFHRIPNISAHVDRRGLLNCHRDTIAGPCIYLAITHMRHARRSWLLAIGYRSAVSASSGLPFSA